MAFFVLCLQYSLVTTPPTEDLMDRKKFLALVVSAVLGWLCGCSREDTEDTLDASTDASPDADTAAVIVLVEHGRAVLVERGDADVMLAGGTGRLVEELMVMGFGLLGLHERIRRLDGRISLRQGSPRGTVIELAVPVPLVWSRP